MKIERIIMAACAAAALGLAGCKHDDPNEVRFDNKVFIDRTELSADLPVKPTTQSYTRTLSVATAKPVDGELTVRFEADASKVERFCEAYYTEAELLPEEFYTIEPAEATIPAGGVKSSEAIVGFHRLDELDMSRSYVLPVSVRSGMEVLESARTYYYLLREGAIINVVADMTETYVEFPKFDNPAPLSGLRQITMEALVKVDKFDRMISTVMGIEGLYLMRIGDAGYANNQIQIAGRSSNENFPTAAESPAIPVGRWVHIAVTHDLIKGDWRIYLDGEEKASGKQVYGTRTLAVKTDVASPGTGFHIGLSYDKNRWLAGCIAECRIWNVVRTQAEIAAHPYEVDPASEGLVAYWKFDEGSGTVIRDSSPSANHGRVGQNRDGEVVRGIGWTKVWLPEKQAPTNE